MTRPTHPPKEPIDEPVRPLLWRLRARLVTPPAEDRVAADLDRIILAAREQAHEAVSHDASARPDVDGVPRGPDHPVVSDAAASADAPPAAVEVDELAARRRGAVRQLVGQAAAVALLVVAVGAGVAGARDGGVTLNALLGRDTGEPAPEAPDEPSLAVPLEGADPSDEDPVLDAGSGDDAPVSDTTTADDADASPEATDRDDADASDSGQQGSDSGTSGSGDTDSGGTSGSGGSSSGSNGAGGSSGGSTSDDGSDGASSDDVSEQDEIVAAPPEEEVDGFGGRSDCDGEELADCTPEDDATGNGDDGDADAGGGDQAAEGDQAADDTDAAEDLARRRFSGNSADDGDGDAAGDEDADEVEDGDE